MSKKLIVIVDDQQEVGDSLKMDLDVFKKYFLIEVFKSSYQSLKAAEKLKKNDEQVALFLLDQRMPELEGIELARDLQKIYPEAKKIMVTGQATYAEISSSMGLYFDAFQEKPWNKEELIEKINFLLYDRKKGYFYSNLPNRFKHEHSEQWAEKKDREWCIFAKEVPPSALNINFKMYPPIPRLKENLKTKERVMELVYPICSIYEWINDGLVYCGWTRKDCKPTLMDNTPTKICDWSCLLYAEGVLK